MYKIKLHKTSKWLWPLHIDMYVVKWMGFFRRFHKSLPKIHRNVLRKITIDLLYFWDVYDVNLWGKNSGRSTVNQAEVVFPITYFKGEAVIGRRFSKIVILQCSFFALVKAWGNACDRLYFSSLFISSSSLSFY